MPKPPKNRILAKLLAKIKEKDSKIKELEEQLKVYAAQDSARKRRDQFSASASGDGKSLAWSDSDE